MSSAPVRFLHEPRTEQEVVCLFAILLEYIDEFPNPVIIEKIHESFPDCFIRVAAGSSAEKRIAVEFKLYAESYNHAFDGSVLVCWKKGRERRWPQEVRIVELAPVVQEKRLDHLFESIDDTYCTGRAWSEETLFAIATREGTPPSVIETMREIAKWADSVGFGPDWRRDPKPQFDVGRGGAFFTVWSDGKFRLVVKRFAKTSALADLIEELRRAAPSLESCLSSVTSKKRWPLAEHFSDTGVLRGFLEVWESFR